MKEIFKQAVGIDLDKDKFDVCFSVIDNLQKVAIKSTRKFSKYPSGFIEFEKWVSTDQKRIQI